MLLKGEGGRWQFDGPKAPRCAVGGDFVTAIVACRSFEPTKRRRKPHNCATPQAPVPWQVLCLWVPVYILRLRQLPVSPAFTGERDRRRDPAPWRSRDH